MKKGVEYGIQSEAVQWFRGTYPEYLIFSVPTEATWRNKYYFEGLGSMAGVSDTIVLMPNTPIFVEFKAPKGRQSAEQKEFQIKIEKLGYRYFIVRSVEEFKELINEQ